MFRPKIIDILLHCQRFYFWNIVQLTQTYGCRNASALCQVCAFHLIINVLEISTISLIRQFSSNLATYARTFQVILISRFYIICDLQHRDLINNQEVIQIPTFLNETKTKINVWTILNENILEHDRKRTMRTYSNTSNFFFVRFQFNALFRIIN